MQLITTEVAIGTFQFLQKIRNLICWISIAIVLWATNSHPVYADISLQSQNYSVMIELGESLEESELDYWHYAPEEILTEKQLLKLSKRLRDLARYLGSKWPINFPLLQSGEIQDDESEQVLLITDLQQTDDTSTPITAGQALKLVTQEIQVLKTSDEEPVINLVAKDERSETYILIVDVPLSRYCYELLQNIF